MCRPSLTPVACLKDFALPKAIFVRIRKQTPMHYKCIIPFLTRFYSTGSRRNGGVFESLETLKQVFKIKMQEKVGIPEATILAVLSLIPGKHRS